MEAFSRPSDIPNAKLIIIFEIHIKICSKTIAHDNFAHSAQCAHT